MFKMTVRSWWNGEAALARLLSAGANAARLCAEYLAARARMYAPVDTGRLKASIRVIATQAGRKFSVLCTAPYARYVEYGSLHGSTWIAPNPFMRRALADARKMFPQFLKEAWVAAPQGQSLGVTFAAP